jgi:hypothetical protein
VLNLVLPSPFLATHEDSFSIAKVIHVGPPKTATTNIQYDLTRMNETLALDNYVYAGRYYYPAFNTKFNKFVPNRKETPLGEITREMFKPQYCKNAKTGSNLTACVAKDFKRELDQYHGHNVLLSDESYSMSFKGPKFYKALRDVVGDEWEVRIIVAYRRFFQWLPSDMFQRYRMDKDKGERNWKNNWPTQEGPGEKVTLLFPLYYKMWSELGHQFMDTVLDNVQDTFPVKILNLHTLGEKKSVLSAFLCDMVPDAPTSCLKSVQLDQEPASASFANDAKTALHVNYDMLTTGVAELGLIDLDRFKRKPMREALQTFTEVDLGKSPFDFDLNCPGPDQLEEFLNMSLALEAKSLGHETAEQMEVDSRDAFRHDVEKRMFCEVDVHATIKKDPWKSFFAQYAPKQ